MRTGELIEALRRSAAATQVADRRRSLMTEAADRLDAIEMRDLDLIELVKAAIEAAQSAEWSFAVDRGWNEVYISDTTKLVIERAKRLGIEPEVAK
jgi:hypothetical protein